MNIWTKLIEEQQQTEELPSVTHTKNDQTGRPSHSRKREKKESRDAERGGDKTGGGIQIIRLS